MRKHFRLAWVCVGVLIGVCLTGSVAQAASPSGNATANSNQPAPALDAAQAISTITGVAISPLLGVGAYGAYHWFKAPPEKRPHLAWYAQPWFWVPALLLVALTFVKDTFGAALPTAVKKPFDVLETIENKISGLVAAGAFVPLIAAIFRATDDSGAWLGNGTDFAIINLTPLLNVIAVPLALAAFVVVWLVSHVIHVLILISPFTLVDTALKSFRLFLLSTVTVTSFANPYAGAVWSLVIIALCSLVAGWAFRLFVFGTVFTWDLMTFRKTRFKPDPDVNWVFTGRKLGETPIRTYGRLTRAEQGGLQLSYRPWLLFRRRTVTLPATRHAVGRGLFYSEIIEVETDSCVTVLTLPPRYRTHEEKMSGLYELGPVQDIGVVKGIKGLWRWIKELFGARVPVADST